jgi:hypothetical protein
VRALVRAASALVTTGLSITVIVSLQRGTLRVS